MCARGALDVHFFPVDSVLMLLSRSERTTTVKRVIFSRVSVRRKNFIFVAQPKGFRRVAQCKEKGGRGLLVPEVWFGIETNRNTRLHRLDDTDEPPLLFCSMRPKRSRLFPLFVISSSSSSSSALPKGASVCHRFFLPFRPFPLSLSKYPYQPLASSPRVHSTTLSSSPLEGGANRANVKYPVCVCP